MKSPSDPNKPKEASATAGRRADDSSLFSLESLKIKEAEAAKQSRTKEDSGLIDLRALAAMERAGDKPSLDVAPLIAPNDIFGVSPGTPLIAPPQAAAVAAPPQSYAPPSAARNNTPLILGGAIAAVGIAVAVFTLTRGAPQAATAPTASATVAAAVTAAPAPTAEVAPEPSVVAVIPGQRPSAPATATAAADKPPPPVVKGPLPKAPSRAAPKEPAEPAPPPKPVETCDLACQMQRAVNKKK